MQDILVYLIVAGAAFYLGRSLWGAVSGKKSGCNSCGSNCGSNKTNVPQPKPLIQIDLNNLNGKH